jgi:hypothetical protein
VGSEYLFIVVQRVKKVWVFLILVLVNWFELFAICFLCRVRLSKNVVDVHLRMRTVKPTLIRNKKERETDKKNARSLFTTGTHLLSFNTMTDSWTYEALLSVP